MYGFTGEVSYFDPNGPWSWTNSRLPRRGRASWETWHQTHGEVKEATAADTKSVDGGRRLMHKLKHRRFECSVEGHASHGVVEYFFCFLSFLIVLTDSGRRWHMSNYKTTSARASVFWAQHAPRKGSPPLKKQALVTLPTRCRVASGRSMLHTLSWGTKNTTSTISSEESCYTNSHDGRCPTRMDSEGARAEVVDAGGVWSSCS